jgi:hypothetical protein
MNLEGDTQDVEATATSEADVYVPGPLDALAKDIGWLPPDKFSGAQENFVSAEDYIKKGVENAKYLKRDLKAVKDTADRLAKASASITERALEEQRIALEAAHEQAVEDGDAKEARRIATELSRRDVEKPQPRDDFKARNQWFDVDDDATAHAIGISQRLHEQGKSEEDQLAAAEAGVRKVFPHLFGEPKRGAPSVNAPTTRAVGTSNRAKGAADLPAAAKQAGEEMVRMFATKMPKANYTLADYAKTYWAENE